MIGSLIFELAPKSKQSVQQGKRKDGSKVFFTPTNKKKYQEALSALFMSKIRGPYPKIEKSIPVIMVEHIYLPIRKGTSMKKRIEMEGQPVIVKPDVDNLIKPLHDALEGLLFEQDQQVFDCHIIKLYSSNPRIEIKWKTFNPNHKQLII